MIALSYSKNNDPLIYLAMAQRAASIASMMIW